MPVVLITGASSGIGRACAEFLAARGHKVYGGSRSAVEHPGIHSLTLDVRDDLSVVRGVEEVLAREGRLDVLVNNAGIVVAGAVEDVSIAEARAQFEVNFFGVLRMCRAVLPGMRLQGSGCIVNVGSIAGLVAAPFHGLYSASKFALEGLSESLRMEVRDLGIRVVLIEPGDHRTGLTMNRRKAVASPSYSGSFERAVARMEVDEQKGPDPLGIARLIDRVIQSPNPRLRYTIGPAPERASIWLKRFAPYSVVEMVMRRYYGAKP